MPSDPEHRFAVVNGIRLHYVEQGEGPLVVLSHGWPESWCSWRHQIPALVSAGFRVVAPDQRGYGLTEAPPAIEAYDIFNLVGDLVGLVNALGAKEATLIGHDWGSIVAAHAALLRPDLFTALGLLSVPFLPRRGESPSQRFSEFVRHRNFYQEYFQPPGRIEAELEQDIARSLLGILYTASGDSRAHPVHRSKAFAIFDKDSRFIDNLAIPDQLPDWLPQADLDAMVQQAQHSGFRGGINWYRNMDRNWRLTPFLNGARILQPALFIAGALDGVLRLTAEEVAALEINVPHLTKKALIPGAGHWIQQERPEEVNALLIEFLMVVSA